MSLLNAEQIFSVTGAYERHFNTFASGKNSYCVVVKEPIKTINTNINDINIMPGYGNSDYNLTDISFQSVSGIFPCISIWGNTINNQFTELKFNLGINDIQIRVKEDCKNYIINGKTESIILKNKNFTIDPDYKIQDFFGSLYYFFKLTSTQ